MAELLSQSREASARIRVENIIHADITVELMEILELYAELLLARAGLLDVRDKNIKDGIGGSGGSGAGGGTGSGGAHEDNTGLEEAAASLIYAAPRLPRDVRELPLVRNMLIDRFGKEFAVRASDNVDGLVPARVADKLKVDPPGERLVQAYLEEIARTYSVDWPRRRESDLVDEAEREIEDEDEEEDDDDGGVGGGAKETPILAESGQSTTTVPSSATAPANTPTPSTPKPNKIDIGNLQNTHPPSDIGAKSPVSVAPPGARSDNPSPKVRLPGGGVVGGKNPGAAAKSTKKASTTTTGASTASTKPTTSAAAGGGGAAGVGGKVPTVDDLAKRFAALK